MVAQSKPLFVYINGYPGIGKLTVAKALCNVLPNAKLFDNHSLIDATSRLFDRSMPEYQPMRRKMRRLVLDEIVASVSTKDVSWIFTDQQSSDEVGSLAARDYYNAAQWRNSTFVSIILLCDPVENARRLVMPGRGDSNTKLTDLDILREIRATEDIYHFGGPHELEIDVTNSSVDMVATQIKHHILSLSL